MGYNYRCSLEPCRQRVSFKKRIEKYVVPKLCSICKQDSLKPTWKAEVARSRRRDCFCRGPYWPHNKGRIEDENHTCIHANMAEAEAIFMARDMGATTTMKTESEDCPF